MMEKKVIYTKEAPEPVGPYSQAVALGNLLFCSGQIPLDSASGEVFTGDIQEQTRRVMANVAAVLAAAEMDFSNVVKTTIFLTDMGDFGAVNEVYATYFEAAPPARSTVQVSALPKGVNVEIEVVAARGVNR